MTIISSIKNSFQLMRANKARTALTLLGLVIGIMTVIIVYAAGEGIRSLVIGQVESFGTDTVYTEIKVPSNKTGTAGDNNSNSAIASGVQVTTLTNEDMEKITTLPNIKKGYAAMLSQEQVSYGNELRRAFVLGAGADYIDIDAGSKIEAGRFFSDSEDKSLANVVVVGQGMKTKLFGDSDPVGKTVKIRNERFTVIGVMAPRGAVMFMSFDDYVYVPIRTLQKKLMGINHVSYTVHQLENPALSEETADDIRYTLRERHEISDPIKDDFRVTTMVESLEMLDTITNALTFLLLGIVAISLLVGGVGIMNIMYVSVTERTMEIGLRKAVGASYANILRQFLIEAILITVVGGFIGSVLGTMIAYLMSLAATALGFTWHFSVPAQAYIVAIVFSLVCGIVFGVTPARSAAKLDPIEALRTE